jgi:hypothetical protein
MIKFVDRILSMFGYYRKPASRRKRICTVCQTQIKRSDRWHIVNGKPQHRDCPQEIKECAAILPEVATKG